MKKAISILMAALTIVSLLSLATQLARAPYKISWASTMSLPEPRHSTASVAYEGRIYILGGSSWISKFDTVYYCKVNPDGTINPWLETTRLPDDRWETVALACNGYIYLLGGGSSPGPTWQSEVWYAEIQADGTLSSWISTTSLPRGVGGHGGFVWDGRLYVLGGWTGSSFRRETYFAEVQPDGSLGSWISTSLLPEARGHGVAAIAHNGYAYASGGQGPPGTSSDDEPDVWYAKINSDGTLDPWMATTSLPVGLETHQVAVVNNQMYVIGGVSQAMSSMQRAEVYRATINLDGTLGAWNRDTDLALPLGIEPRGHLYNQAPVLNERIYVVGGTDEMDQATDTVYYTRTVHEEFITATIDIDPDTLNLKSNGEWITVYLTLPNGYNIADIIFETVNLEGISAAWSDIQDGVYMVKFDRAAVKDNVANEPDYETAPKFYDIQLAVTGKLADGPSFNGSKRVTVMKK